MSANPAIFSRITFRHGIDIGYFETAGEFRKLTHSSIALPPRRIHILYLPYLEADNVGDLLGVQRIALVDPGADLSVGIIIVRMGFQLVDIAMVLANEFFRLSKSSSVSLGNPAIQ